MTLLLETGLFILIYKEVLDVDANLKTSNFI